MVDIFILLVFILMICVGLYRGFVKEILGLFGLVASISLAIVSNKWIVDNLLNYDNDPFLSSTIAYILSFLLFSIIFSAIICLILKVCNKCETSVGDRLLGAIIGGIKAYLLCLLFYFVVYGFNSTLKPELSEKDDIRKIETITPEWLKDSKTYPFFYNSVAKLDNLLKKLLHEKKEIIEIPERSEDQENKNELSKKLNDEEQANSNLENSEKNLSREEESLNDKVKENNEDPQDKKNGEQVNKNDKDDLKKKDEVDQKDIEEGDQDEAIDTSSPDSSSV